MSRTTVLTSAALALLVATMLGVATGSAQAGTLILRSCSFYSDPATAADIDGPVWAPQSASGYALANACQASGSFRINANGSTVAGGNAQWHTVTPPTIGITGALTPLNTVLIAPNMNTAGYQATYFWNGGVQGIADGGTCCDGMDYGVGINRNDLNGTRYFGFQVSCVNGNGCQGLIGKSELLDVKGLQLIAQDNAVPTVQALGQGNLWYEGSRWVRGAWPISFQATDDSGVCGMRAIVNGQAIQGPTSAPNQSSWTQCPTPQAMNQSIDTATYPDGSLSLLLSAVDAASPANVSSPSETLHVDNTPVTLGLGGPTDAVSTGGVQYVGASASAGPSGVADIQCSVDGSPYTVFQGAAARVPVAGIGLHTVSCFAQNNSVDANLNPGSSAAATWHLSIRQPTVSGITFGARLLDALRCHRVLVRVKVRGHWVTIRRHGKRIRVHRPPRRIAKREVRCHPRVVIRKVRSGGHIHRKRIVLLPHTVQLSKKRVRFGHEPAVSGWVSLADGTALAGVPVQVITATDNGLGRWRLATLASTDAHGLWHAKLRAGPSRLIAAVYPGSDTTEPATSGHVRLIVPTRVTLRIRPQIARWRHKVRITGRVLGGNIPAGKLLRLRIGTAGIYSTVGIPDINHRGRYRTSWTFAPGRGLVRYWFSVSTLPEADYPYAQTTSRRVYVTVHG